MRLDMGLNDPRGGCNGSNTDVSYADYVVVDERLLLAQSRQIQAVPVVAVPHPRFHRNSGSS